LQLVTRQQCRAMGQVRLVGEGTNTIINAMEAFARAEEEGLDLVLVGEGSASSPPVVRIQDFKKLLYEAKKAKSKQAKAVEVKEIQLRLNISDHDLGIKIAAIQRFLERGDKVKVSVRLKGRERETPHRATELIERVTSAVPCKVNRVPGPMTLVVLEPNK
jgi:translation initiation factor IF-3